MKKNIERFILAIIIGSFFIATGCGCKNGNMKKHGKADQNRYMQQDDDHDNGCE